MPLRFRSIMSGNGEELLDWLMEENLGSARLNYVPHADFMLATTTLKDGLTNTDMGKIVYTFELVDNEMQLLDIDIVLRNSNTTGLEFCHMLPGSSDANEYYQAEIVDAGARVNIETVNRHTIEGELQGSVRNVSVSAFPFQLSVYDSIEAFQKETGVPFSDKYAGCSFGDEIYATVVGKVMAARDVRMQAGDRSIDFVIAWLDTALGMIPAAMSRDVFDLESLAPGKTVVMNANLKADLAP